MYNRGKALTEGEKAAEGDGGRKQGEGSEENARFSANVNCETTLFAFSSPLIHFSELNPAAVRNEGLETAIEVEIEAEKEREAAGAAVAAPARAMRSPRESMVNADGEGEAGSEEGCFSTPFPSSGYSTSTVPLLRSSTESR
jgi:hypothetical protein